MSSGGGQRTPIISPDGERVALSTGQGKLLMFDASKGLLLGEHQAGEGPRGRLCWSPDGGRVLAVHAHAKRQLALLDREGKHLSFVEAPQEVKSAAFVSNERVVITNFQSNVSLMQLRTGDIIEQFARSGFEIGVAACQDYIALTFDHGHLLLRAARPGAVLPDDAELKRQNQAIYEARMARNELRLQKIRDKGGKHTLNWERSGAEKLWKNGSPAEGWKLWLPLPHCQIQDIRFMSHEAPLLLLCDGRDVSLLSVGPVLQERLLLGLFPHRRSTRIPRRRILSKWHRCHRHPQPQPTTARADHYPEGRPAIGHITSTTSAARPTDSRRSSR